MRRLIALASLLLTACAGHPARTTLLEGETMGSAWTVKVSGRLPVTAEALRAGVQARFDAVNSALSTYRADSALSRFNDDAGSDWVSIDPELAAVLAYALTLGEKSDGAYDVTVGPLVNLWGFGPDPATHRVPDASAISAARERVGWRKVQVDLANTRARKTAGVRIDLSSLGKGRGVDRVAEYLDSLAVTNYLIDLSGKLRARGSNAQHGPWRVAVEQPGPDNERRSAGIVSAVVALHDESIATAGDYRRYFETGGQHYSHIIDPHTGAPVTHATVSATALGSDCMQADALATVFMVMPPDAALRLANELRTPALLIGHEGSAYQLHPSTRWRGARPL